MHTNFISKQDATHSLHHFLHPCSKNTMSGVIIIMSARWWKSFGSSLSHLTARARVSRTPPDSNLWCDGGGGAGAQDELRRRSDRDPALHRRRASAAQFWVLTISRRPISNPLPPPSSAPAELPLYHNHSQSRPDLVSLLSLASLRAKFGLLMA